MESTSKIFIICIMSMLSLKGYSQGCPTSGYPSFYSCSDIAQFVIDYPGCNRLPSTLRLPYGGVSNLAGFPGLAQLDSISGSLICDECDLSSLVGLENLNYVGGSVTIDEPHGTLVNLQGLNNLSYIGGGFNLYECSDLVSTNGLDNLLYIGDRIWLLDNTVLSQITGFENISHLPGQFWFDEMDAMIDLSGFDSLITIGGYVRIWDNALLNSLGGFNKIELIGGYLDIAYNDMLIQLDALDNLNTVGNDLHVRENETLDNIEGLSSLVNFNGEILVYQNSLLTNLDGIENIAADSITNLILGECDSLSICSQPNICQYLINSMGPSTINLNNSGCNSIPEITAACAAIGVDEINLGEKFSIYPNPITDATILKSEIIKSGAIVHFYNYRGDLVKSIYGRDSNQILIDRTGLSEGLYLLRIVQDNEVIGAVKIVVII
jgi:hypothetical protein